MKKITLFLILIAIIGVSFNSCNRDTIDQVKTEQTLNVDDFVAKHLEITSRIHHILSEKYLNDKNFILDGNKINKFTTQEELDSYLESIGFDNSIKIEFINLLKEEINLYKKLDSNPNFSNLDNNEKEKLISNKIILFQEKTIKNSSISIASRSCVQQWNVEIDRCERNYALETGLSIVGGIFSGGVGGLIGFAGATAHWTFCIKDARDDYYDCKNG